MKRTLTLVACAVAGAAGAGAAQAQIAIGGGIGTTGATIEAQIKVVPGIILRGGYNYLQYEADDTYDDIAYQGDLDLNTLGAFVDFHPFGNSFFVTGGAYFGEKSLDLNATPTANVQIGNQTFTPAQVGTLNMTGDLEDTAPFVGLGWDTTFEGAGLGLKFVAGAMFTGSPQVNLVSTGGSLSNDTNFQAQLAVEEQNLRDDVNDYEVYPVVQLGLTYSF
ncbi:MAG: hypothetical protein ABMA14_08705 [Hyphomonadaceae bacterium]